jgi:23S rRNA G2445 N2-methylase RlmL
MGRSEHRKAHGRAPARETFFATCAPGLEPLLDRELRDLRLARVERQVGGARFEGTLRDAWIANLWLRTAVRVLLRLARFPAPDADALYAGARGVDWSRWLARGGTLAVAAHTSASLLDHSRFVEQRVKDAVVDQLREAWGERPSVEREDPDLRIHAQLARDRCTLLVDTSGEPLHKRGWRRYQGRAPLSETLAAALVIFSGWDRRSPLLDPFCGSGTILVEAACLAAGIAPGGFRERFAFERLPGHDAAAWSGVRSRARAAGELPRKLVIAGSDRDPATIEGARENLRAAGLEERVSLEVAGALEFAPRKGWNGWIVTNPPYGERVGTKREATELFRRFGELLRERCGGFHVAVLCGDRDQARALAIPESKVHRLWNGPIECLLVTGKV